MARLIGRHLNLFTVASGAFVGTIRNCNIEKSFDTQENGALKDAFHYFVATKEDWRITFTVGATDDLAFDTSSKTNVTRLMGLLGTAVAFTVETASAANNGTSYSGTGVLMRGTHDVPDGLQEGSFEIVPQSALTVSQL
jgi:hypothetical protein